MQGPMQGPNQHRIRRTLICTCAVLGRADVMMPTSSAAALCRIAGSPDRPACAIAAPRGAGTACAYGACTGVVFGIGAWGATRGAA